MNIDKDKIQNWLSTENGEHFPVLKGQSKKQALNSFLKDKKNVQDLSVEDLKEKQNFETGKGVLGKWVKPLEDAGYDIEIRYQDANPTVSANRVIKRALETGRIIPTKDVFKYGNKPRQVFEDFKKMKNSKGEPYVR